MFKKIRMTWVVIGPASYSVVVFETFIDRAVQWKLSAPDRRKMLLNSDSDGLHGL